MMSRWLSARPAWYRSPSRGTGRATPGRPSTRLLAGAVPIALAGSLSCATVGHAQTEGGNELPPPEFLAVAQVNRILRQAVAEAEARDAPATIAVVDRVGNVLAVYRMDGADPDVVIDAGRDLDPPAGLAGLPPLPIDTAAAISKAITAAYLSSAGGNAFGTRTANQIVQENFNPGSRFLEGGPLFGVQISQLPCSDFSVRFDSNSGGTIDPTIGPKRTPLGFSADAGGLPLYEDGALVGAIGVIADGVYGVDNNIRGRDRDVDELIALAGTRGFRWPEAISAERINVDGRSFRLSDARFGDLRTGRRAAAGVDLRNAGDFVPVRGYYDGGGAIAGQAFGTPGSGIVPAPAGLFDNERAFVLAFPDGTPRFPPRDSDDPIRGALTEDEVRVILNNALEVAFDTRGLIRHPLGQHAEVTIHVVDRDGDILGSVRTPDAPVFGTDVSLQKARSSTFFSSPSAPADLRGLPQPGLGRFDEQFQAPGTYVDDVRDFFGRQVLGGRFAFSNRTIGNIARPFYPDGINGTDNGPLSVDFDSWSPFGTGLQVDLVADDILRHVLFVLGLQAEDTPPQCAGLGSKLANGLQIFSGGMPIYRGNRLVGGIGVSGDGIDQDAMIAFLGLHRAGRELRTGVGNAPERIRGDRLQPQGAGLRYVTCPYAPFLGTEDVEDHNVCQGL